MYTKRQLDNKKIIISVVAFVVFVIVGSMMITKDAQKNKKEKNLEIDEPNKVKIAENSNVLNNTVVNNKTVENVDSKSSSIKTETKKNVGNNKVPVVNPEAVALCKQAQTAHEKNIYLTFDDGPSPNITPQILETLKKYDVTATFFVLGSRVELYPELVKQEYNEGHYIANHGYTHTYSAIYSSVQAVIDEYNKTDKAVQNALGNSEYHTLLFRFPGGSSGGPYNDLKQQAKSKLESMGIASTNWNCLNGDAEGGSRTKQQLLNRLYETAKPYESLVVLMHDANDKQSTADALPEIIEHYQAEGYTFKNYYEIFQ